MSYCFMGRKARLRGWTEETQLHLGLLALAQARGLQFSCQYDVIVPSAPLYPMNDLPASPPASLYNEFHLLLLKLLGNCQTPGLG